MAALSLAMAGSAANAQFGIGTGFRLGNQITQFSPPPTAMFGGFFNGFNNPLTNFAGPLTPMGNYGGAGGLNGLAVGPNIPANNYIFNGQVPIMNSTLPITSSPGYMFPTNGAGVANGVPNGVAQGAAVAPDYYGAPGAYGFAGYSNAIPRTNDTIQASFLSDNRLLLRWNGVPAAVQNIVFGILDKNGESIQQRTVTQLPAEARLQLTSNTAYYRVRVNYINGTSTVVVSPL